jgi:tripeptidyl-peptidase-1
VHIDFITPTIHFDAAVTEPKKKRQFPESVVAPIRPGSIDIPSQIKQGPALKISSFGATPQASQFTLANCNSYITPDCLRALYGFPPGTLTKYTFLIKWISMSDKLQVIFWNCGIYTLGISPYVDAENIR